MRRWTVELELPATEKVRELDHGYSYHGDRLEYFHSVVKRVQNKMGKQWHGEISFTGSHNIFSVGALLPLCDHRENPQRRITKEFSLRMGFDLDAQKLVIRSIAGRWVIYADDVEILFHKIWEVSQIFREEGLIP